MYCMCVYSAPDLMRLVIKFVRKNPPAIESSPLPRGDDFDSIVTCSGAHFENLDEAKYECIVLYLV